MKKHYGFRNACIYMCVIVLLTIQCNKDKKSKFSEINPEYATYISAFTSGIISNSSTIKIQFYEEISGVEAGQISEQTLFSFSPSVKGETYWIDNRTIAFRPSETLPSGKFFKCKFDLAKVVAVPSKLKTFEFEFQTMKQGILMHYYGFKAYDPNDLARQKYQGNLTTADYAEGSIIAALFSARQEGKNLPVSWDHSPDGTDHYFTIDSVVRSDKTGEIALEWKGKLIDADENSGQKIEIPALGDFKVVNINIVQQPEQCITVYFSDPLDPGQDLEGLIYLKSGARLKLLVLENEVRIYPEVVQKSSTEVIVEKSVKNVMDYELIERFSQTITFTSIKPDVELIGEGVILPSSNGLIFPFKAVNLSAINVRIVKIYENNIGQFMQVNQYDGEYEMKRVGRLVYKKAVPLVSDKAVDYGRWNNFALDLSEMIKTEPGAIYRVHISFDRSQSLYPCDDTEDWDQKDPVIYGEDPEIASYDNPQRYYYNDDYYYDDEDYDWRERDDPCKKSYYMYNNHTVVRNVFASDLGIIAKSADGSAITVAVTDLRTTEQLADVTIELYNFQNQFITSEKTNSEGIAVIDAENKPFLLVAKKGDQRGYLRLDDGTALSLSMFDVNGQNAQKGIKGFIYGERGVWRPGDSIYISFVLEDKNKMLPEHHPVLFELYTPDNQMYLKKIAHASLNGFYSFKTATSSDAPTGNWLAKVVVGGAQFTKTIKIETIKPNRLKINLNFPLNLLKSTESQTADLTVAWLHGAVAKNLKADVTVMLAHKKTSFNNYADYNFDDPTKGFESEEYTVFDGMLNAEGRATVNTSFKVTDHAPGMLQATFKIRAFETGGDFSTDIFTMPYSSYSSYVGLRIPEGPGWNGAVYSNEPTLIPIVTVNENGKPVNRSRLKIQIYSLSWRWWWERSDKDDLARYIANNSSSLIKTDYIDTREGRATYEMNLGTKSYGRKLILITDPVSGHTSGQLFYTTYSGWYSRPGQDNPAGAEMLTFRTDKDIYHVGDKITVELPENESGKALVSVESGSKVLHVFWVDAKNNNYRFSFEATSEMAPNAYIHISYIQPYNNLENDMPIRLYGVQNISVEDPDTHLEPVIRMPDVLAPEEKVTIKVSEAKGQKMTYTVAVVDEGLLDLTRFSTPDPWKSFYARDALGVKTWDMYRYVAGAFSGEFSGLLAIGGDEEIINAGEQKANRFVPVVKFLGPFTLKSSGTNSHTFVMPNYVGSVRTMVVAGYNGAYGKTDKTTPVKKPLMVLATLPRVLGPGESVSLPVTVFAMDPSVRNVSVDVATNELLSIKNGKSKTITFSEEGDQVVYFDLNVENIIGMGTVSVTARSGQEVATYNIEIDVRMPNPEITSVIDGVIEAGKTWTTEYRPIGIKNTRKGVLEISTAPAMGLEKRLEFLINYPHGCIEQVTSSVFPQLFLSGFLELKEDEKKTIEKNIKAAIDQLRLFQLSNGGFTYWPGSYDYVSEWGTSYAGHFLLEAKSMGYHVPQDILNNWISFQQNMANNWSFDMRSTNRYFTRSTQIIQAYRLYTLALAGKPALGAMNRMKEYASLTIPALWRLAAAYHLAGRKDVANNIVKDLSTRVESYREFSYSYGSTERDQAMILETLNLLGRKSDAKAVADELAEKLGSARWFSTQTTSYSLLALAKFYDVSDASGGVEYTLIINGGEAIKLESDKPFSQHELDVTVAVGKIEVDNHSEKPLFTKVQLEGIPLPGEETAGENALNMSVRYLGLNGNAINTDRLEQGTDFIAEVTIHHPGIRIDYEEMALSQIFPSGWEIRNVRMDQTTEIYLKDIPEYQDIRDDRVYTYFDIRKNQTKIYRVLLNAAYLGRFYLPSVYCEAMYDHDVYSRIPGKWIEVVEAGK